MATAAARRELFQSPMPSDAAGGRTTKGKGRQSETGLNPDWVEWLMGLPIGWTSLEPLENGEAHTWDHEPECVPRVVKQCDKRRQRLTALGNAIVPQCVTELLGGSE